MSGTRTAPSNVESPQVPPTYVARSSYLQLGKNHSITWSGAFRALGACLGGSTYRLGTGSAFLSAASRFDVTNWWTSGSGGGAPLM